MRAECRRRTSLGVHPGGRPASRAPAGELAASASGEELDAIVVRDQPGVRGMQAHLLSREREHPAVALTRSLDMGEPVLAPGDVRSLVGAGPRIYYIPAEHLLDRLAQVLGPSLALPPSAVRVWWPELSAGSDPCEHPLLLELDGEPEPVLLAELAREFELSRPLVRREIKLIEQTRRLAEDELAKAREQNRNMKIERHEALTRAEAAEASLEAAARQSATDGRARRVRDEMRPPK
jgi:hypothetical protein